MPYVDHTRSQNSSPRGKVIKNWGKANAVTVDDLALISEMLVLLLAQFTGFVYRECKMKPSTSLIH